MHLPHIAELTDYGEITVGQLRPIGCVATACDEDNTLAMLVRRNGSVADPRLDQAIAQSYEANDWIDEVNPPSTHS